jgi:iron complex outermembrane recepter protein
MKRFPFALGLLAAAAAASAQQTAPTQQIVITGNPLQRDTLTQPAAVLAGDELVRRRAGTLGETLEAQPGVANTWFGPNAGRPVIRGLDGDRIRLLDNGGASVDASNLSFDHAVAIDPLVVERIEVLRGPAALLYGGNATGGVVNTIDNRIPRQAATGLSGRAELRAGGAASERSAAALLEGGSGTLAWHVDGFTRRSSDLRVPRHTPVADGEPLEPATRVRNSAGDGSGGAVGAGWIGSEGRIGLALDGFRSNYGVTAEPDVTIRMKRDRVSAAGEWRGWSFQAGDTDYRHQEIEGGGEVGTTFDSRGRDLRLQGRHGPVGGFEGVFGVQYDSLDFSALGEEAFVPGTRSRNLGFFLLESLKLGALELQGGLRTERAKVASEGDGPDAEEPRFGDPQSRRFSPTSASLGATWTLAPGWRLQGSLGRTERAPAYYELYADGLHLATAAYERGDPALGVERSVHLEGGLAWQQGPHSVSLQVFTTRFSNYIALEATGQTIEVEDEEGGVAEVPEYAFRGVRARLTGFEVEARTGGRWASWDWGLAAGLDQVRGTQRDSGEPLPRLAPWRARLGLTAGQGPWQLGLDVAHSGRQSRVPATDVPTDAHTRVDLWARWRQRLAGTELLWTLQARNLGDTLAYQATTIATLRGLVPLPGRSIHGSVQVSW